jgi:hypothetical protein
MTNAMQGNADTQSSAVLKYINGLNNFCDLRAWDGRREYQWMSNVGFPFCFTKRYPAEL